MRKRAEEKQNVCDAPTEGKRTARTRAKRQTKDGLDKLLLKYPTVDDVGGMILQNSCELVALKRNILKPEECTVSSADIETLIKHFIMTDPQNYSVIMDYMNVHTIIKNTALTRVGIAGTRFRGIIMEMVSYLQALTMALPLLTWPNEPKELEQGYIKLCNMFADMLDERLIANFASLVVTLHEVYLTDCIIIQLGKYTGLPLEFAVGFISNDSLLMAVRVKEMARALIEIINKFNDNSNKNRRLIKISQNGLQNLMSLAEWDVESATIITVADVEHNLNSNANIRSLLNVKARRCKE